MRNFMNLIKSIFILFVIVSCQEKIIWQETYTDKTIKIESKEFKPGNTNYIYNWSKPSGPDSTISYTIEHNKMLINQFHHKYQFPKFAKTPFEIIAFYHLFYY